MIAILSSADILTSGLWLVFFAAAALALSLGLILAYHWFVHAHNLFVSVIATCAYIATSAIFLSAMTSAIFLTS